MGKKLVNKTLKGGGLKIYEDIYPMFKEKLQRHLNDITL